MLFKSISQRSPIHPSTPRLFQIKLLRNAVNTYQFPNDLEAKHRVIQRWIETDRNGTLAKISEVQLHGEFLGDIFRDVLGYGTITQSQGKKSPPRMTRLIRLSFRGFQPAKNEIFSIYIYIELSASGCRPNTSGSHPSTDPKKSENR